MRISHTTLVVGLVLCLSGCSVGPGGGGDENSQEAPSDDPEETPVPLEECRTGELDVRVQSTDNMQFDFGELTNQWVVAEGLQSGANQTTVSRTLGASSLDNPETALEGNAITVAVTGTAKGQSGQFGPSNDNMGVTVFAVRYKEGYIGDS